MATEHPGKTAARLCSSPNVAARESGLTKAAVRAIRELQVVREKLRRYADPLIINLKTRPYRTSVASRAAIASAQAKTAKKDREKRAEERSKATRKSLLAAARVARKMGLDVRKSVSRNGRVSSYYCSTPGGKDFRISDHEIPWTAEREHMAVFHGRSSYTGFHGSEIIIDEPRSDVWLRRAIILARAGRM